MTDPLQYLDDSVLGLLWLIATLGILRGLRWMAPRIESLIETHDRFVNQLSRAVTDNSRTLSEQTEALVLLTRSLLNLSQNHPKKYLLIVEQDPADAEAVADALEPVATKHNLELANSSTITDAHDKALSAAAIVLDILLPDIRFVSTAKLFTQMVPCPVVVYTRPENSIDWAGILVVRKPDLITLRRTLETLLNS